MVSASKWSPRRRDGSFGRRVGRRFFKRWRRKSRRYRQKIRSSIDNNNDEANESFEINIPFVELGWFTVSVPLFGFWFCIIWSMLFEFEETTYTDCRVYNFLPSVSAAIGRWEPQKFVWKTVVTIQASCRTLFLYMYYRRYCEARLTDLSLHRSIKLLTMACYVLENAALVVLSFWTSSENYEIHKLAFSLFLIMSLVHMRLSYKVTRDYGNNVLDKLNHGRSLRWKYNSMIVNVISTALALYFFYRHNRYCEPLVYSMFALAEYALVMSNMAFHTSTVYDFPDKAISLSANGFEIVQKYAHM